MNSLILWFVATAVFILIIFYVPFAVWVFMVPLFCLLARLPLQQAMFASVASAVAIATIVFYWTREYSLDIYVGGSAIISSFLFLYFIGAWNILKQKNIAKSLVFLPSWWLLLLFVYSFSILGSYWMNLSVLQPYTGPLMWLITSYGVTFLIVLVNVLAYYWFTLPKKEGKRFTFPLFTLLIIMFTVQFTMSLAQPQGKELTVSLVQGNFPESWQYRTSHADTFILKRYLDLSRQAARDNPDVIVWPEYALSIDVQVRADLMLTLSRLAKETNAAIVVGTLTTISREPYARHDTTITFFPDGTHDVYHAVMPIPAEDFVIAEPKLGLIRVNGHKAGITMCYEETQRSVGKALKSQGAQFIISQANNQHFGKSHGLRLAAMYTRLMAVENKMWVVRATNNGLTQVVSPYGKVVARLEQDTPGVLTHTITL